MTKIVLSKVEQNGKSPKSKEAQDRNKRRTEKMKNQNKTAVTIKTEESPKTFTLKTELFNIKGRETSPEFKTQLLEELVDLEEVPQNETYKTLHRVKNTINEFGQVVVISIPTDLLRIFNLKYLFVSDTYLYKVGEFKVNLNVYKGLGVKTVVYSYLLFDEIRTVLLADKADLKDIEEELHYIGKDSKENKDWIRAQYFNDNELQLLETLKRLKEEQKPQAKPVDEIKPAYFIYQEMKRQGETKALNYCLAIAQGKTENLRPDIISRYESQANEIIEQGRTELIKQRERKAELKEQIKEAEDYYMQDLLF